MHGPFPHLKFGGPSSPVPPRSQILEGTVPSVPLSLRPCVILMYISYLYVYMCRHTMPVMYAFMHVLKYFILRLTSRYIVQIGAAFVSTLVSGSLSYFQPIHLFPFTAPWSSILLRLDCVNEQIYKRRRPHFLR